MLSLKHHVLKASIKMIMANLVVNFVRLGIFLKPVVVAVLLFGMDIILRRDQVYHHLYINVHMIMVQIFRDPLGSLLVSM